jgi:integrase
MEHHTLMGGKLHLYKRPNSSHWQCSTYLAGKNHRKTTKEDSLSLAKDIAEDWYLELRGKSKANLLPVGKTFRIAAEQFLREYPVITEGQRNPAYVQAHRDRIRVYLNPFFGDKTLGAITSGVVQEYRVDRLQNPLKGKPPARSTLHQEIVTLRQVLKTASRHGWLHAVPDLSPPYKTSGKISHRAWFSPDEYRQLYEATRKRAENPTTKRWKWASEQLHDMVLLMANSGLRPDEAKCLQHRDVTIVKDHDSNETILVIEVRGKRGVGYCKSTTRAVRPYLRLKKRNNPKPTDLVFPGDQRILFNTILDELNLKFDRDGNRRTLYSLRHTYICFRLTEGADIYQIAKNCRTSVEMIEKFYAVHLKNTLDASAINVMKKRAKPITRSHGNKKKISVGDDCRSV